ELRLYEILYLLLRALHDWEKSWLEKGWQFRGKSRGVRPQAFGGASRVPETLFSDCSTRPARGAIILSLRAASCYNGATGTCLKSRNRKGKELREAPLPAGEFSGLRQHNP
ncbi:MAG TPA: hypothetical protein VJS44_16225, partial [Pyrinomonadaceae bacterium]|nr:hypothetical protein [Pyrinomonadaceae bacterium]